MNKEELEKFEKLKELTETAGGKYLIETQKEVVLNTINSLINSYQEKSHAELVTLCAKLASNFSLLQLLTGIPEQIESIKELLEKK